VPTAISSSLNSRFIIRARDVQERFAQEALRWLSTHSYMNLHFSHIYFFKCCMHMETASSQIHSGPSIFKESRGFGQDV
jgi:hypothetical protein